MYYLTSSQIYLIYVSVCNELNLPVLSEEWELTANIEIDMLPGFLIPFICPDENKVFTETLNLTSYGIELSKVVINNVNYKQLENQLLG